MFIIAMGSLDTSRYEKSSLNNTAQNPVLLLYYFFSFDPAKAIWKQHIQDCKSLNP